MDTEIPSVNRVDDIRDELSALKGQRIKVRANMGRSRIVERSGTLVGAHPSLSRSRSVADVVRASPISMLTC